MLGNDVKKILKLFSLYKQVIKIADEIINDDDYRHVYFNDYVQKRKELEDYKNEIFKKRGGGNGFDSN